LAVLIIQQIVPVEVEVGNEDRTLHIQRRESEDEMPRANIWGWEEKVGEKKWAWRDGRGEGENFLGKQRVLFAPVRDCRPPWVLARFGAA
jgi:hypothetical protein